MSELKIKGKIVKVLEVESGTSKAGKEWKKQGFVIDTGKEYNPEVCFSMFGDEKVDNFAKYNKEGQEVEVSFNVSSREFNGKYFHNLDAWMVKTVTNEAPAGLNNSDAEQDDPTDDLPF